MTVRWKPLLILSGVFVAVALGGLVAFTLIRAPKGTEGLLVKARAERQAKRFDEAEIVYKQALQVDGRNPAIHEEFAGLYEEWSRAATGDKAAKAILHWHACLGDAAKFGPTLPRPRRRLLDEALSHDDFVEAARWATELLKIEPDDATSHYVLAADALEATAPNLAEVKRHLDVVLKQTPRPVRALWIAARVAQVGKVDAELAKVLAESRAVTEAKGLASPDALALFRLRALDVETATDPATLGDRVKAVKAAAEVLTADPDVAPSRIARVSKGIEGVQGTLARSKAPAGSPLAKELAELGESLEAVSEAIFRKVLAVKGGADLGVYFAYADHLRFRDKRVRCLEVIDEAFKSPAATKQGATDAALSLHALAVHAVMTDPEDASRFAKAEPHIKALIEGTNPRFRAFGHMYKGQAEIEQIGVSSNTDGGNTAETKARASALGHLKTSANELPEVAEAQARYGVALILSRETELGRVYLQRAAGLGHLEPRYQIWAAWSMVHGGYPEYAEPIVNDLIAEVKAGNLPKEMAGILHLVSAEIHQARRTPEDLAKAIASYQEAFANGQPATATVQLRLAQIELMLNRPDAALVRLSAMAKAGQGGPGCELLTVNTLRGLKRFDDAAERLKKARAQYPRSGELLSLQAEILVSEGKAEEADRVVADFLKADPDNLALVELRSAILADSLNKPAEARALLSQVADRSERTSPLVRLAQLDIRRKDYEGAATTIAKIRNRWKDASLGDMLDAQVALAKGNPALASTYYEAALKKDPNNKLLQYWKAQLDGRTDPKAAKEVLEGLAAGGSVKEVNDGVSLMTAAQSALANLELETGDVDGAIARYQGLLKGPTTGNAAREMRWKLVGANVAKKQWPAARAEIESLLNDPATPATAQERIAAAMYYRNQKEEAPAVALIDGVLKEQPAHPWAVTVRTQMDLMAGRKVEARDLIRRAIAASPEKAKTPVAFHLLLAAVENVTEPAADGLKRSLAAIEAGLADQPDSLELAQAKCRLLTMMGDPKAAIAYASARAKADATGGFSRLLLTLHRDVRDYAAAEAVAAGLYAKDPNDRAVAVALVRLVASQAIEANGRGERSVTESLNARTATLIRDLRAKFPADPTFVQLDCELAVRRGETSRALSLTQEIDKLSKGSTVGSLIRANIYAGQGRNREVVAAYNEALEKNPRQPEVRLLLAQADLKGGDYDDAVKQTTLILDADPDQPAAVLVRARALAATPGSASQVAANRASAIESLKALIKSQPENSDAYHLLAEVHVNNGARDLAADTLEAGLVAVPTDAAGLSIAVRILGDPKGPGKPADPASLARGKALAARFAADDKDGTMSQAAFVGFHHAGQLEAALPWGEKAAGLTASRIVHMNFGDLLLSLAEANTGPARDAYLTRALAEFDRVLKEQPTHVGAVNNKAWVLHAHLNRSQEALEIAEGLVKKADPATLPAEFHDTLGAIQEAVGRTREAEESYTLGLKKSPEMPVLNYHMGRLMASDKSRARKAATYLDKAKQGRDGLSPEMLADLTALTEKVNR